MSIASDQRIRHVAIVLQSLDATTSRGLLGQLPPAQSKLVRQAMVQLGTVTPQERAAAFQSMQGLLNGTVAKSAFPQQQIKEPLSPAAALLASQKTAVGDHIDLSPEAMNQHKNQPESQFDNPIFSTQDANGSWQNMPAMALADILQGERPIVIATVINQVSVERATAIAQALPMKVAAATLAALPHLYLTDPAILRDIQSEVERKIGQYQAPKQANEEGISKLKAIVASMPMNQQEHWTRTIAQVNPVLATKLGWKTDSSALLIPFAVTDIASNLSDRTSVGVSLTTSNQPPSSSKVDIFDESMILPFPPHASASTKKGEVKSSEIKSEQTVAPNAIEVRNQKQEIENLLQFSDKDFVAVLHACQPQTVLLALSGTTKSFVARVERLMPSKDVKRLRERLNSLGPIQLLEVDAAQSRITETAMKMLADGQVGATASVSFTAAA